MAARPLLRDLVRRRRHARRRRTSRRRSRRLTAGTLSLAEPDDAEQSAQSAEQQGRRRGRRPLARDGQWRAVRSSTRNRRSKSQYGSPAILAGISNQRKSRAGAAFSGQVLSATNNIIYEATIEQGWAGDLLKVQIDPHDRRRSRTLWTAAPRSANQIKPPTPGGHEPWMDEANRRIVTWNGATRGRFRATPKGSMARTSLSDAQLNTLSPDPLTQKKMVAYLRGGTTWTRHRDPTPAAAHVMLDRRHGDRPVPQALRRARRHLERAAAGRLARRSSRSSTTATIRDSPLPDPDNARARPDRRRGQRRHGARHSIRPTATRSSRTSRARCCAPRGRRISRWTPRASRRACRR